MLDGWDRPGRKPKRRKQMKYCNIKTALGTWTLTSDHTRRIVKRYRVIRPACSPEYASAGYIVGVNGMEKFICASDIRPA